MAGRIDFNPLTYVFSVVPSLRDSVFYDANPAVPCRAIAYRAFGTAVGTVA
jgi:hypothetical protein